MAAAVNTLNIPSRQGTMTYDDYVELTPPDSGNYELHQGTIIYMPSPSPKHQDVVTELCARMRLYASQNRLGKVFSAPLDTVFSPTDTVQPDILFIRQERLSIVGSAKIEGAPDLVVEVLSESNIPKEMSYKKHLYESNGVQEYWLINLKKNTLTVYANRAGELLPLRIYDTMETAESDVLTGFRIAVAEILEN